MYKNRPFRYFTIIAVFLIFPGVFMKHAQAEDAAGLTIEELVRKAEKVHALIKEKEAAGIDIAKALKLDQESRAAAEKGDLNLAGKLLDNAIGSLSESSDKEQPETACSAPVTSESLMQKAEKLRALIEEKKDKGLNISEILKLDQMSREAAEKGNFTLADKLMDDTIKSLSEVSDGTELEIADKESPKSAVDFLKNPGFEKGSRSGKGTIDGWINLEKIGFPAADRKAKYLQGNEVTHSGKGSAKIIKISSTGEAGLTQEIFGLEAGKWYQASVWIKTEDIQATINFDSLQSGVTMSIVCFIRGVPNPVFFKTFPVQKTQDWREEKVVFVIPEGVGQISVLLAVHGVTGTVWFDDVSIVPIPSPMISKTAPVDRDSLDKYGGLKLIRGKKTGFFHIEKIQNRWWLIDPEGNGFVVIGVSLASIDQVGSDLYKKNLSKYYKSGEEWIEKTSGRLRDWGFNTVFQSDPAFSKMFVYEDAIGPRSAMAVSVTDASHPNPNRFPDVFDEKFKELLDKEAAAVTKIQKGNPRLLGYFLGNELPWNGNPLKRQELFDIFFALSPDRPGKRAVVNFLINHYANSIEAFKAVWGTEIKKFEELLTYTEINGGVKDSTKAQLDKSAFLRFVANVFFEMHHSIIRKYDTDHMILGVRFVSNIAPSEVLEAMGNYVDVVCFQPYDAVAPIELFERSWHYHKKPILITEFGFKAMDSGLPNTKGPGYTFKTQKERGIWYERYISRLIESPLVLGWVWYQYVDQPASGRATDGENNNFGLLNIEDQPYSDLVNRMREIHSQIYPYLLNGIK